MKTKSKLPLKTPDIYELYTAPTATTAKRKVIVCADQTIHLFADENSPCPPEIAIDIEFKNFDDFLARGRQTILLWHANTFKCEADKKQDLMATALYVWAYFTKHGTPHLPDINVVTGEKERKSSYAGRQYFIVGTALPDKMPPQAKTCYNILAESLASLRSSSLTENQLKDAITRRSVELKTKQDPWRIFQYYRPQLIAAKLIKHD